MFNDTHCETLPFWSLPERLNIPTGTEGDIGDTVPVPMVSAAIRTDFGTGIYVRSLFSEPYYLSRPEELVGCVKALLFCDGSAVAECADEAILGAVVWYLSDGRVPLSEIKRRVCNIGDGSVSGDVLTRAKEERADEAARRGRTLFSYKWDMPDVWAAFLAVYHIDLCRAPYNVMHLWQFDALFRALPAECTLVRTFSKRGFDLSSTDDDDARAAAAAQKILVGVPDDGKLNEMCNDIQLMGSTVV